MVVNVFQTVSEQFQSDGKKKSATITQIVVFHTVTGQIVSELVSQMVQSF